MPFPHFAKYIRAILAAFVRARSGAAAVEFALLGLATFAFFFAILNLGLLGFTLTTLQRATEMTARTAAVNATVAESSSGSGVCPTVADVTSYFNQYVGRMIPKVGATGGPTLTFYTNASGTPASFSGPWVTSTSNTPTGTYIALGATYRWSPIGFVKLASIPLTIRTVAFAMGSLSCTDD